MELKVQEGDRVTVTDEHIGMVDELGTVIRVFEVFGAVWVVVRFDDIVTYEDPMAFESDLVHPILDLHHASLLFGTLLAGAE